MFDNVICRLIRVAFLVAAVGMTISTNSLPAQDSNRSPVVEAIKWKDLPQVEKRIRDVYHRVQKCVVGVGSGTGTIIREDGLVLTAHHVIKHTDGEIVPVTLSDGRRVDAKKLGYDVGLDMALLKIIGDQKWPHVELGYSCRARPGEWCVAIGYPAHATRKRPPLMRVGRVLAVAPLWLATDCLTEGGDSGGPLFDLRGRLLAFEPGGSGSMRTRGKAYIAVDAYREASAALLNGDRYWHPQYLKQQLIHVFGYLPAERAPSAQIGMVIPNSPAGKAGLKAGDVIVEFDDVRITKHEDMLKNALNRREQVPSVIRISRGKQEYTYNLSWEPVQRLPAWDVQNRLINGQRWLEIHPEVEKHSHSSVEVQALVQPAVSKTRKSVVVIYEDGKRSRLGLIVAKDGVIVTTAAGLKSNVECRLEDDRVYSAKVIGRAPRHNLAVLKVDARGLTPVQWHEGQTPVGTLVVSVHQSDRPLSIGVIGTETRPLATRLSVENCRVGATVAMQFPQLHVGDTITHVDGVKVASEDDFRRALSNQMIGDPVVLQVFRKGKPTTIKLESLGHPEIFLHDATIGAVHEGGPAVGLDGRVLGINVGRSHYVSTCMLPAYLIRQSLAEVMERSADTQK